MIKTVYGNILESTEDIIVHQVNCQGVMGAGLAKQIKSKWPMVFEKYKKVCGMYKPEDLLGKIQVVRVDKKIIINVFGQLNFGTDKTHTNYEALFAALRKVREFSEKENKTVSIPYGIGCGLAGGDWNIVIEEVNRIFQKQLITIYKLKDI